MIAIVDNWIVIVMWFCCLSQLIIESQKKDPKTIAERERKKNSKLNTHTHIIGLMYVWYVLSSSFGDSKQIKINKQNRTEQMNSTMNFFFWIRFVIIRKQNNTTKILLPFWFVLFFRFFWLAYKLSRSTEYFFLFLSDLVILIVWF